MADEPADLPAKAAGDGPADTGSRESGARETGPRDLGLAASGRKRFIPPALTKQAHDRLTLFAVRALFFLTGAGLGLYGTQVISVVAGRPDLDPAVGVIAGCVTALVVILVELYFSRSPIRTLAAITFGLMIGLVLSLFFRFVVQFIAEAVTPTDVRVRPAFELLLGYFQMITTTVFCYFGVTILLGTKDDFKFIIPYVEFRKEMKSQTSLILDTSCFVDGRIFDLLRTGIFEERLVVPTFVLHELQTIADASDRSLRERGRRGMDILHEIERTRSVEIVDHPLRAGDTVDESLLIVAGMYGGKVITTDYNLQKAAKVRGIPLLNVNDIAAALKPAFVPGETMTVRLLREGDDRGQAVGFLADGTMVVVENARQRLGQEVTVEVTSSLQTSAGKMVFGRLGRPSKSASSS